MRHYESPEQITLSQSRFLHESGHWHKASNTAWQFLQFSGTADPFPGYPQMNMLHWLRANR